MRRQKHRGQRKGRIAIAFLALTLGGLLLSGPALAVTKYLEYRHQLVAIASLLDPERSAR